LQRDTAAQIRLVGTAMNARGMLDNVEATAMATAYSVQRADLVGYRRLLSCWHESSLGAAAQQVIRGGLGVIDAVEADTRAVLATLARK
jgi:hypothetical protein